ncbi:spinster family MFS transporter [Paraburkholderia sabiae]|uniref:MFS transporter n=1 Tax=Paraburkholderia sabiae TaxID=273251 RepID=A0ABU9QS97_9BURK|nr:MFS transporter [Paraburkholderia sabiae]WJZ72204.1 MFS transporter [Paraburkholderia sabiae]CAD6562920.1 putative L-galactonate transporter [Paraburkholderia sabiae]
MNLHSAVPQSDDRDGYLVGRRQAWFAFAMTFALMLFDYIDRQVIVSLFPHLKAAWGLSDMQLGSLVSIISIVVAAGGVPVALMADRFSRVKSIFVMAAVWSLATISCMFARNFGQLFAARAVVGLGETGYGSVGGALIASLFPKRLRTTLLGAFFAAASLGSVLGVMLGGVVAAHWGWKAAFGIVGVPGLVLAFLYLLVPDYKTVELAPRMDQARHSVQSFARQIISTLTGSPTVWWTCLGAALQLVVVSMIWSWLPSYFHRYHGAAPDHAGMLAAVIVLCGAAGSVIWGVVADRLARRRPRNKLVMMAILCTATLLVFMTAFGGTMPANQKFLLIALGGLLMMCTVAPTATVVLNVIHPGVRSTGAAILALFQNLFGLAVGPFVGGLVSDAWGLQTALAVMPAFGLLAALCFLRAMRTYESELATVADIRLDAATSQGSPVAASA